MRANPAEPGFRAFQRVSRLSRWSDDRLTRLGRLSVVLLIGSTIFATDPTRTSANVLASIVLAFFVGAGLTTLRWRPRLRIQRELPATAKVGTSVSYRLRVVNEGPLAELDLEIRDRLPRRFPSRVQFAALRPTVAAGDNWFDRRVGFLSWLRALHILRGGEIKPLALPPLPAHGTITVELSITPLRRGVIEFSHIEFARPDPFGLIYALYRYPAPQRLTVLPRHHPMPRLTFPNTGGYAKDFTQNVGIAAGEHEFHALREYRAGDPLRHIHWRASAKRGAPVVKQFVDAEHHSAWVVIDPFALPQAFEPLMEAAASVISALSRRRPGEPALVVLEPTSDRHAPDLSSGSPRHLLERLAHLAPTTDDVFEAAIGRIALTSDIAYIFLTTHWDLPRQRFSTEIAAHGSAALSIVVTHDGLPANAGRTVVTINPEKLPAALAEISFSSPPYPHRGIAHA